MNFRKDEVDLFKITTYLLGKISLDCAMRISIEGTDMKEFDFPSAYSKWLSAKDRKFDSDILSEMAHSYLKK